MLTKIKDISLWVNEVEDEKKKNNVGKQYTFF